MVKHKKPFVDKKNSSTYHVLHRSQRDVSQHLLNEGDTDATVGFILWPAEGNNPHTNQAVLGNGGGGMNGRGQSRDHRMQQWRETLKQSGLLDDSNESERYLKEITGAGTFLAANGKVVDLGGGGVATATSTATDWDMLEVKNQVDNIPLKEALDEEMAAILYGDTDAINFDDLEELNDDFVLDAAKEESNSNNEEEAFDYDAHIQKLLEKARQERHDAQPPAAAAVLNQHEWARRDRDFFNKSHALPEGQDEDEDDDSFAHIDDCDDDNDSFLQEHQTIASQTIGSTKSALGAVAKLSPDEERALREKFEQTLLEYDSDEIGDNADEEIQGPLPLEGDERVEAALDDYLQEKEDQIFMQGRPLDRNNNHGGGSGFSALVGTRMVQAKELTYGDNSGDVGVVVEPVEQVLAEAKARLAEPPLQPPPEEIILDGQSYFSERVRNPWDCESILSTYSNLDNNPVTISTSSRRKRRSKINETQQQAQPQQQQPQIQLSNKTGLPLGVLIGKQKGTSDHDDDDDSSGGDHGTTTVVSVNKGLARQRQESAQEKKARKLAVKRERQVARIQKKVTREVFQQEFSKHHMAAVGVGGGDAVAGTPVFRYS
ncbi:hypothetical protein ACA910_000580 [Epithemia clementina (nom. ined.)]